MSIIEKAVQRLGKDDSKAEAADAGHTLQRATDVTTRALDDAGIVKGVVDDVATPGVAPEVRIEVPITTMELEGIILPDGERSRTAEEMRLIKRPLLQNAFAENTQGSSRHANLIMITSAIAGEGKTFTSLNLAISMTMEMDRTVLLVDADVARPGLSRLLHIDEKPGLIECLDSQPRNLGDVMLHADVPKLTLVPAGSRHLRSTELLGSKGMQQLLDEIALRYSDRIVLFDSPPLLEATEASVLANHMGQIVLVVESSSTAQYLVKEAVSQLDRTDNVSLILNKSNSSPLFSRYGYGYGYGYGQQGE